ncbi:30S ribosomal protein S7 [Candidatus Microgenomates bacterium]|nr:30S ribosomal protein S7 [Candidatus Microgenomates bacterium]
MSRGSKQAPKREIQPDPVYGSVVVAKFINNLMWGGKKSLATRIFYDALEIVEKKTDKKGIDVFNNAIKNVSPSLKVRSRRIGGANYQVPMEVKKDQKVVFAIKWILGVVRAKKGRSTPEELAEELILASDNQGGAIKKKEDTHKMAESNRAYAHFGRY